MLAQVRVSLHQYGLFRPEARVLVAVSGGPDSLALLHLLLGLSALGGPQVHVAHLDHGTRGTQSAAEAQAVAALAHAWGLPATIGYRDVPALARIQRQGLLAAARYARYNWLAATAQTVAADAVAVAHQADDQAETVLLHLLRGAGLTGLRGMVPMVPWPNWLPDPPEPGIEPAGNCQPSLIRPLLATPRAQIAAYCAAHGLRPSDDPSNHAERFARTRVRRMLHTLSQEQPRLVTTLGRTANLLAEDYDFIQTQLDAHWPDLVEAHPSGLALRRTVWIALHPALQRYALRRAATLLGQPSLSMAQLEQVRQGGMRVGQRFPLGPRVWAEWTATALLLGPSHPPLSPHAPQLQADHQPLPVPGQFELGAGWAIVAQTIPPEETSGAVWVALDPQQLDGPLEVRRRQVGDRFRPAGGRGSRKLQDFFVDRKIQRTLRDGWPLLVTPHALVWVVGLCADARFVATSATQGTIWVGLVYASTRTEAE
ncbi:MAG: tRNA lysidine(34) synthetase TilS [Oscillochloridaceae bacterium umkhey_bin13]